MERMLNAARRVSLWLAWIGGGLMIASALLVAVEVFLRRFAGMSIGGADELSGYAFAVATSFAFAFALFERAHIRVDALYSLFPQLGRFAVDLLGLFLLVGFAAVVAFTAWGLVADTLAFGSRSITPLRTPLALPQIPWLVGWLFFVLCGVLIAAAAIARWARGDVRGAGALIGVKSVDEQIEDETA